MSRSLCFLALAAVLASANALPLSTPPIVEAAGNFADASPRHLQEEEKSKFSIMSLFKSRKGEKRRRPKRSLRKRSTAGHPGPPPSSRLQPTTRACAALVVTMSCRPSTPRTLSKWWGGGAKRRKISPRICASCTLRARRRWRSSRSRPLSVKARRPPSRTAVSRDIVPGLCACNHGPKALPVASHPVTEEIPDHR